MKRTESLQAGRHGLAMGGLLALAACHLSAGEASSHWAFRPLSKVEPPAPRKMSWTRNPVDRFILADLEAQRLTPAPAAGREQLLRRVTFDITGLPPTPEEIDAFLHDRTADAYTRLIDRLLASPRYGERWARHWLDLARYAESDGFEHDAVRPHSWRYRDYVIRAFNEDKPFNRFIREQLAGDECWPNSPEARTATAFNLLGPDMVDSADQTQRRLNTLNDMTDTAASVFLGLTFGCARCHDHKFEPFTQRDYFSFQAFFAPAVFERERAIPTATERTTYEAALARYQDATRAQQEQIEAMEASHRQRLLAAKLAQLSEDAQMAHRTPKDQRTVEQENTVQETAGMLKISEAELAKDMTADEKARRKSLLDQLKKIPKPPGLPTTMALATTNGLSPKTFILHRGDYNQPGEEMQPAFPVVLRRSQPSEAPSQSAIRNPQSAIEPGRRTTLADWLVSPANPLTARIMVNRIWQHHFGRGLVATPSDFGTRGARPTHPELLDWLASEFIASGWSVKGMHRLILLSAAYQQSSDASPASLARDPENRLVSRQNRQRLEGEAIRDSLLVISGQLNTEMGGPSVLPPVPADITRTSKNWTASPDPADHARRSIYVFARRNLRFPFFEAFDAPDNNLTCPERGRSTTAPQSLTLLNSEEVMTAAAAMAGRLMKDANSTDQRIDLAFRLALGRPPIGSERARSRDFLHRPFASRPPAVQPGQAEFTSLCRALFNLNAFVYVD